MIRQNFLVLVYNKDVTCVIDPGKEPICTTSPRIHRRSNSINQLPSHDPYIPRKNNILFNCSVVCKVASYNSMTELISPNLILKSCYPVENNFKCDKIRYHYLKNNDKILFLSQTIYDNFFYIIDCLVYAGGERVCHKKDNDDSHAKLVDTGTLTRPKELNILSQDEFICEENEDKQVNCDLNPFVPFEDGLKLKETAQFGDTVLLKSGTFIVELSRNCIGSWCGYSGPASQTRRTYSYGYRVPGDMVYRCYYAKKQQVCKPLYLKDQNNAYNNEDRVLLSKI